MRYYEAPIHLKANGGIFLLDDFGRQDSSPRALLNRLIVALERRIDYLTLAGAGMAGGAPLEAMGVFSTKLETASLVGEAFLRRGGPPKTTSGPPPPPPFPDTSDSPRQKSRV